MFASAGRKRLGHYELFERFAVGAMAELFLGRARGEEGFEKMVVIKRVLPRLAEDARFMQMLQTEARIHASLSHKNIVQIHDLGLSGDGEYFIVLEYVDGRDLGALLENGPREQVYKDLQLAGSEHSDVELIELMAEHPGLIQRPIAASTMRLAFTS